MSTLARPLSICALLFLFILSAAFLSAQTSPPNEGTSPTPPVAQGLSESPSDESQSQNSHFAPTPLPTSTPAVDSCLRGLPAHIVVSGAAPSTQCSEIVAGSVGNDEVMAAGVVAAVDVWSWTSSSVEVCFKGKGRIAFLDATSAPRALGYPAASVREGMTCAQIGGPGTVALTRQPLDEGAAPASNMGDCQLTTLTTLYVRATPGGQIVEITLPNTTLVVTNFVSGWYKVRYWVDGWVSSAWVTVVGDGC